MNYLLFFIYLFLICWLLTKIKFIQKTNLGNRTIIILFLLRILMGFANGWINLYYYPTMSDSLSFHVEGIAEYHLMFSDPKEYLLNLFANKSSTSYGAIFDVTDSFWNNLRSNIIIKLLSLFNIFSNGSYFINVVFYNFLIFFGSVALYRIFIQIFTERRNTLIITIFLLPSFLYFTSGIHRDGLIFLAIALVCFNMFCILNKEGATLKRVLYIFLSLSLIFLLRNFVFITIIPALTAWVIAEKKQVPILPAFITAYVFFGVVFFSLKFIHPKLDLPQYVSERQLTFVEIAKGGGSSININPLFPNFRSFLNNAPQALNHSLMRPYISESKKFLYVPAALEILIYEILFLGYIILPLRNFLNHGFIYYGIFFTLSMYLIIGYTIPILGALIRYRSIYFPFVITPLSCLIDKKRLYTYYIILKNNIRYLFFKYH
ncbi:MAG: hypothetical protein ABIN97_10760 [Ginsengibacter sp.]